MEISKALQKKNKTDKYYMIRKKDGTATKTIEERQAGWAEWITQCFQIPPGNLFPDILHMTDETWQQININQPESEIHHLAHDKLTHIRTQSPLKQLIVEIPQLETGSPNHAIYMKYRSRYSNSKATKQLELMGPHGSHIKYFINILATLSNKS